MTRTKPGVVGDSAEDAAAIRVQIGEQRADQP